MNSLSDFIYGFQSHSYFINDDEAKSINENPNGILYLTDGIDSAGDYQHIDGSYILKSKLSFNSSVRDTRFSVKAQNAVYSELKGQDLNNIPTASIHPLMTLKPLITTTNQKFKIKNVGNQKSKFESFQPKSSEPIDPNIIPSMINNSNSNPFHSNNEFESHQTSSQSPSTILIHQKISTQNQSDKLSEFDMSIDPLLMSIDTLL